MQTRKTALVLILSLLVLLMAAPLAFAQDFTGDKVVVNERYVLAAGEILDGNLVVVRGSATLEEGSLVRGYVTLVGGSLDVAGEVRGNLGLFAGDATLRSTADIGGDLAAFGARVTRAPGAVVRGDTFEGLRGGAPNWERGFEYRPDAGVRPLRQARTGFTDFIRWQLGSWGLAILYALLGVLLVVLAPRGMQRLTTTLASQTALSFGVGFLTWVLALLAGGILLIACGLGLLVWLALLAASLLGWAAVALWVGWAILRALKVRTASSLAEVVLGAFIIAFLVRVPWCGFLFTLVGGSLGLGAVVLTRFGTRDAQGGSLLPVTRPSEGGPADWEIESRELAAANLRGTAASVGDVVAPADAASAAVDAWLTGITGITPALAERLAAGGIVTPADLAHADVVRLAELTGIPVSQILAEDWIGQARRLDAAA